MEHKEIITREEFIKHLNEDNKQFNLIHDKLDKLLLWSENLKFSWKAIIALLSLISIIVGIILGIGRLWK